MPFPGGTQGAHDDGQHQGSAKRDAANGVAGLNASAKVPDANLESPVGTHAALTSTHGGVLQTAAMKDVASGIAGLDASSLVAEAQLRKRAWLSGSDIYHSHAAEATDGWMVYTKMKTITLTHLPNSTLRIHFKLSRNAGSGSCFGRIYRNGVAVGTERSTGGGYGAGWTENISGWAEGDTLEFWGYQDQAGNFSVKDFNILYNGTAALVNS